MSLSIAKLGSASAAFGYYSERDDYYVSDHSSAEWYGHGADALGLASEVGKQDFHDVLNGEAGGQQVGNPERRTPGWDLTFSAGKGASVAALVNRDERVITAFDASVRDAMAYAERFAATTRQRDGNGHYKWADTHNLTAALVRHNTSRDGDPQLHVHAVVANMTLDPDTGAWRSLDSRALYAARREVENVQANSFALRLRELGYAVDWHIRTNGSIAADIADVDETEKDLFSSRRKEIEAALIKKGIDPATASREARQAATLDTRSPKVHEPGCVLHARWEAQARAAGFEVGCRAAYAEPFTPEARAGAATEAVKQAMESIAERETRFTSRQLLAEATTYSRGRASQADLAKAVAAACADGTLIDRVVNVRGHGGGIEQQEGFTTVRGIAIESGMLACADHLASRPARLTFDADAIRRVVEARETKNGHAFTPEQRQSVAAVLSGRDGSLSVIQGYAGTAKTTSIHASIADAAKAAGLHVRAMAPTHSAANTLAQTLGVEYETVAAINAKPLERDARGEVWIIDEAGMVSAGDMQKLLRKADLSGAQVILSGDVKQIGSVGAGSAFQQLQDVQSDHTHGLTDIKRQTSAELKQAVYASLSGDFGAALSKVDTCEMADRADAVATIADRYVADTAAGKTTLVVTLSNADRRDVNQAIQTWRMAVGEVTEWRNVTTLTPASRTEAEARDAARYQPGEILEAARAFRHGPWKGELLTVTATDGQRVTAARADGSEWTFNPRKVTSLQVLEAARTPIGAGDRIVARGSIAAADANDPPRAANLKNGAVLTVDGFDSQGRMRAHTVKGRQVLIDTTLGAKVDLAYAQTANAAQGRTVDSVVAYMRSTQRNLADRQHAYVALSRAKSHATVITDDSQKLADTLAQSAHGKQTALEHRSERSGPAGRHMNRPRPNAKPIPRAADLHGVSKAFAAGLGRAVSEAARKAAGIQLTGVAKATRVFAKGSGHDLEVTEHQAASVVRQTARWRDVAGFAVGTVTATGKAAFRLATAALKASSELAWTLSRDTLRALGRAGRVAGHPVLAALERTGKVMRTARSERADSRIHDVLRGQDPRGDVRAAAREGGRHVGSTRSIDRVHHAAAHGEADRLAHARSLRAFRRAVERPVGMGQGLPEGVRERVGRPIAIDRVELSGTRRADQAMETAGTAAGTVIRGADAVRDALDRLRHAVQDRDAAVAVIAPEPKGTTEAAEPLEPAQPHDHGMEMG